MATRRTRSFRRDAYIGIRLPGEDKDRLREIARKQRRDVSNLALALICRGLDAAEQDITHNHPTGAANYAGI